MLCCWRVPQSLAATVRMPCRSGVVSRIPSVFHTRPPRRCQKRLQSWGHLPTTEESQSVLAARFSGWLAFRRRGDAVQPESAELLVVFGKGPLSLQNHHLTCSWCMLVICSGDATGYVGDDA